MNRHFHSISSKILISLPDFLYFLWLDLLYIKIKIISLFSIFNNKNKSNIYRPKNRGGLGIRPLRDANKIALARLTWHFLLHCDQLRARILCAKYGDIREVDCGKSFGLASYTWRSLVEG